MPNTSNRQDRLASDMRVYRHANPLPNYQPLTAAQVTQAMQASQLAHDSIASDQVWQRDAFDRWYQSYSGKPAKPAKATKWVVTWVGDTPKLELAVTGSATQQEAITIAIKSHKQEMTSCYKWINRYMTAAQTHKHRLARLARLAS
jgi:hypothetical protein